MPDFDLPGSGCANVVRARVEDEGLPDAGGATADRDVNHWSVGVAAGVVVAHLELALKVAVGNDVQGQRRRIGCALPPLSHQYLLIRTAEVAELHSEAVV